MRKTDMSDRYTRLYYQDKPLYERSAPIMIMAGALLLDTVTGSVIAQLKFRNISSKLIKAVKASVQPLTTNGLQLGSPVQHQYLDLLAERDEEFGQKEAVILPDNTTRQFLVGVDEVIFDDNGVWDSDGSGWNMLDQPVPLQAAFKNDVSLIKEDENDLIRQYRLEFGEGSVVMPRRCGGIWYCSCGSVNRDEEVYCHRCGLGGSRLFPLDMQELVRKKNERLKNEALDLLRQNTIESLKAGKEILSRITGVDHTKSFEAINNRIDSLRKQEEARIEYIKKQKEELKRKQKARIKRMAAKILVACSVLTVVGASIGIFAAKIYPLIRSEQKYRRAAALMDDGEYDEAVSLFYELGDYKDSADKPVQAINLKKQAKYDRAEELLISNDLLHAAMLFGSLGDFHDAKARSREILSEIRKNQILRTTSIAAGSFHTVGLKTDGTVIAVGRNSDGQCDVSGWADIVAAAAGGIHTVGLKTDGTVVAVGRNNYRQCNVSGWTDIVAIAAGSFHTVGLKADGTVAAVGYGSFGQLNVSEWADIIAIAAGGNHTVGLKADGTVAAVGYNSFRQCNVSEWTDSVAIAAGGNHTVGLKADGTVVASGADVDNISEWTDIVAIAAGGNHTVGLKADGTVAVVGYNSDGQCNVSEWTDIVAIAAGGNHTVGLKADGTIVAVGSNRYGQCNVSEWDNIRLPIK